MEIERNTPDNDPTEKILYAIGTRLIKKDNKKADLVYLNPNLQLTSMKKRAESQKWDRKKLI